MMNVECRIENHARRRANRWFPAAFVLLGVLALGLALPLRAAQPSNRWLLIVDMSKGMKVRESGVEQTAAILIGNGMSGQMHAGDTVGVWIFNDGLTAARMPPQEWAPAVSRTLAMRVATFLQSQPYEKSSRLDKVIPEMNRIIKDSPFITVVLITDGTQKIKGTAFDDQINTLYHNWQPEQKKAAMPFITVLRARDGQQTDFVVGTPPWAMEFPPLPAELIPAPPAPRPPEPEKKAPPMAPPIIMSGKKTEPKPAEPAAETPAAVPETPKPAPPPPEQKPKAELAPPKTETVSAAPVAVEPPRPPPPADSSATAAVKPPTEPSAPAPTATAVPAQTVSPRWKTWMLAPPLAGVFAIILFLAIRRSRRSAGTSLITRSLEREQK